MSKTLCIQSSARQEGSVSRMLVDEFMAAWQGVNQGSEVIFRDVATDPPPHVDEMWVAAAYTPPEERTAEMKQDLKVSDALVDEFISVDRIVVGTPMYNFVVTSTLKAYIDNIVRVGRTFGYTEDGPIALTEGKKVLAISARGGVYGGDSPFAPFNHQDAYLKTVFGFIGVTDVTVIAAEGTNIPGDMYNASLAAAREELAELAAEW